MKTLILGSSHIRHLETYIHNNNLKTFDLDDRHKVYMFGISGGKAKNASHVAKFERTVRETNPDQIILQIGGNDLDSRGMNDSEMEEIIMRIVSLGTMWMSRYNIKDVVILQFLFRHRTRNIDVPQYNERVRCANMHLKAELANFSKIRYWKIKGIKRDKSNKQVYLDGVHLNDHGLFKYFKSIRGAITSFHKGQS